jgi:glycosyltransferase involved in cell wall biosynthesis
MKVVISHKDIKPGGGRGGICTLYTNLATTLSKLGAEVTIISSWKNLKLPNIKTYFLPYNNEEEYSRNIKTLLSQLVFDIYECSSWRAEGLEYAKTPRHKPVVVRGDLSAIYFQDNFSFIREKQLFELANFRLAVSKSCAQDLEKTHSIKIDHVILNGVNTSIFKPLTRKKQRKTTRKIVWVGKPTFMKGFDLLKRIIKKSPKNFLFYLLLGHSPIEISLNLKSKAKVYFLQDISLPELVRLYNEADVCLSTSRREGFGLTALEAMACGTPVIVPKNCLVIMNLSGIK